MKKSFLSTRKIGVIGYGMFGKFLCHELLKDFKLNIYSPHLSQTQIDSSMINLPCHSRESGNLYRKTHEANKVNSPRLIPAKSLEELIKNSDFIIPAVQISKFEKIIQEIIPHAKKNTIIMDVCSVKVYPVQIMQKLLPGHFHKIATHPMFGPSSFKIKGTFSGLPLVIHNAGCDEKIYKNVRQYFTNLGLQVIEMQPEEHDKLSAKSQFFAQLVKAAAVSQNIHPTLIDTPGASKIFEAFDLMDISRQLLLDMLNYNIHAQKVLKDSIKSLEQIKKNK